MPKLHYTLSGGPLDGFTGLYRGDLAACNGGRGPKVIEPNGQFRAAINAATTVSVKTALARGEDALPVLARAVNGGKYYATGRKTKNSRAEYRWQSNGDVEG
jgi:hypothetical protein